MNRKSPFHLPLVSLLAALAWSGLSALPAQSAALWSDNFYNSLGSANNINYTTAGWSAYEGNADTDMSNNPVLGNTVLAVAGKLSNPNDGSYGFASIYNGGTVSDTFAIFKTGLNVSGATELNWQMQGSNTTPSVQVLLQVGGNWYASSTILHPVSTGTSTEFSGESDAYTAFNLAAETSWYAMTLSSPSAMAVGSLQTLDVASSTITGIGFYQTLAASQSVRFDSLQLVPEPGTTSLLLGVGGLSLLLVMNRRRSLYLS